MFQLITADDGDRAAARLSNVGTVHGRNFVVYGEADENVHLAALRLECVVGPREGEILRSHEFRFSPRSTGLEKQWCFLRRLRLEPGIWRMALEDADQLRLPAPVRMIKIEDRPDGEEV